MNPFSFYLSFSGKKWLDENYTTDLFTVIIPTYNRAHTILESLDSVALQTYKPVEIIIMDDGSTDNTKEVVTKWIERNKIPGQKYHYSFQENRGVCAARNNALKMATGEYIQFLDSDDLLHPDRLELLANKFKSTKCDYIETGFEGFSSENGKIKVLSTHFGHVNQNQIELLLKGKLWPNTLRPAYTKALINKTGPWNEEMETFQDYEYVSRALLTTSNLNLEAIRDVLCSARRDGERMSDIFLTWKGRNLRVHCEQVIADLLKRRSDISKESKMQFVSRIYALGFRSNAMGWTDLGKRCGEIVEDIPVHLDWKGKKRYWVWRSGKLGGWLHVKLAALLK